MVNSNDQTISAWHRLTFLPVAAVDDVTEQWRLSVDRSPEPVLDDEPEEDDRNLAAVAQGSRQAMAVLDAPRTRALHRRERSEPRESRWESSKRATAREIPKRSS